MDLSSLTPKKRKRSSYDASFKLKVIRYAEEHGNRAAGREFCIDEKSVRQWRSMKEELDKMPKSKRAKEVGQLLIHY